MSFPETRTVDQVDDFHGTPVEDPYRWLEDQTSPQVSDWARAQAQAAEQYLQTLPGRAELATRLEQLSALPSSTAPEPRGGRWFRLTNDGVQQQAVLRVADEPMGEGEVLLDPNLAAADGSTSLAAAVADRRGELLAWSYQESGSDWCRWRVRSLAAGQTEGVDLADDIRWAKFVEPCWLGDSSGFVYEMFPPTDPDDIYSSAADAPRLMLHRLATAQEEDELLFALPEQPSASFWPWIDDEGRWLVVVVDDAAADARSVWARDLSEPGTELRRLTEPASTEWQFVTAVPAGLIMRTDSDAPRGRLVLLDPRSGELSTLVAERDDLLLGAVAAGDAVVVSWLSDARSVITVHDLDGKQTGEIDLPGLGSVSELTGST